MSKVIMNKQKGGNKVETLYYAMQYITILISVISVLGVGGIISGVILRRFDKMEKKQDKREEARAKESVLIVRGLQAVGHLAESTAIAQKSVNTTAEMETAFKYYRGYSDDLNAFLLEQNAARNHGQ